MEHHARALDTRQVAELVTPHCPDAVGTDLQPAHDASIRWLPPWVAEYGLAASGAVYWMWIRPADPAAGDDVSHVASAAPNQVVLDVPAGRYIVEIIDTGTGGWVSRESAASGPLVAGLPHLGAPLVVRVRPVREGGRS